MKNKGFTLIELLIVIAIIGVLAAVAIPIYTGQQLRAARTEAYTNLQTLRLLEEQNFAENGTYAAAAAYNGTFGVADGGIEDVLPGFRPGAVASLNYTYAITNVTGVGLPDPVPTPYAGTTAALVPNTTRCFIARATGIAGTRVAGDVFAIDCNNRRNF